ncbi:ATP-binding protein [Sphingomonas spermidinifaciens]|uniref:ATP-binding protein n=1 Tax=Sphingomonas spermidinifaciens TaxID=1141889 RepID=UPI001596DAAD|nr:ATP-binding protein [Sphingomonas spermidinifaciens]
MTTSLLQSTAKRRRERLYLRARLAGLEPLLRTIASSGNLLTLDLESEDAPIRNAPDRFDHVLIELIANARTALACPGAVRIRLRNRRGRSRLMVLDSGCGMTGHARQELLTRAPTPGAHGTGFQQMRRFVGEILGKLRLRSRPGKGTLVSISCRNYRD